MPSCPRSNPNEARKNNRKARTAAGLFFYCVSGFLCPLIAMLVFPVPFFLQDVFFCFIYERMSKKSEKTQTKADISRFHSGVPREGGVLSRRYSRFIRAMRVFLPLVAVMIVGVLMIWPQMNETFDALPSESLSVQAIGSNELIKPRFESEDSKSQPFTVTAERAIQNSDNPDEVQLDKPQADMILQGGTWIAAQADSGLYHQKAEQLRLDGHVKLFHDQGYEIVTDQLFLDVKADKAWSNSPVAGHGPAGTLEAQGMKARTDTGHLIFTGPAKLVLYREVTTLP